MTIRARSSRASWSPASSPSPRTVAAWPPSSRSRATTWTTSTSTRPTSAADWAARCCGRPRPCGPAAWTCGSSSATRPPARSTRRTASPSSRRPTGPATRSASRTTGWPGLHRELLEDPVRAEQRAAVRAAVGQHVVARAQVHREVALDRIPLVVLRDELVELVEAHARRVVAPAPRELGVVGPALLAQLALGAREAAALARDRLVDLGDPLHPARADAGLEVGLHRALRHPRAARDRLAEAGGGVEVLLDDAFGRRAAVHPLSL